MAGLKANRKIPKHWSQAKNEKEEARWCLNRFVHAHCGFPLSCAAVAAARSLALSAIPAWPRLSASSASWRNLMPCELGVFMASQ
jgi:hypothetical protein